MLFAPLSPLATLPRSGYRRPALHSFERFLDEVLHQPQSGGQSFQQDEKAYTLRFDMPGVSREQLKVSIEGATVRIETLPEASRQYKGAYELPQEIDSATSTAQLENGVLTLHLVKLQPVSRATTLIVQ